MKNIAIGYVPLTDAVPLFVLKHLGLDARHGISVELKKMGSWAQARDALFSGQVHAAHCLAGIPLAAQMGLYGDMVGLSSALTLNHYGNAITVSRTVGADSSGDNIKAHLLELKHAAEERGRSLTFASVFPVSKHEFELRHWLHSLGINTETDLRLVVVPPPMIADSLRAGRIDGFCVGEPWNTLACQEDLGLIAATSRALGLPGTEKVLAVRQDWLDAPEHWALIRALVAACEWLQDADHRQQAVDILALELAISPELIAPALLASQPLVQPKEAEPFVVFGDINRPDREHALWLTRQIQQHIAPERSCDSQRVCEAAFRPDVFDRALVA